MNIYECSEAIEVVVGGAMVGFFILASIALVAAFAARCVIVTVVAVLTCWYTDRFPWAEQAKILPRAYFVERWFRSLSPFNHIAADSIDDLSMYVANPESEPEE